MQLYLAIKRGVAPRKGFTLAEVLITLGIIGIIAALTIPSLVASYRKQVVITKLKKVYSVMNQAIGLAQAETGSDWGWVKDCGNSGVPTCTVAETKEWFNQYIGKNLNILKTVTNPDNEKTFLVYFADGSILLVTNHIYDMDYYIDEKALKNAGAGQNRFTFRFQPRVLNAIPTDVQYHLNKGFEPYAAYWDGTREHLFKCAGYGCNLSDSGAYCTKLIQYDGWEIKDDYPIKF